MNACKRPELVQNVEDGHIAAYGIVLPATCHIIRALSFSPRRLRSAVFRSFIREKMRSHSEVSDGMLLPNRLAKPRGTPSTLSLTDTRHRQALGEHFVVVF